MTRSSLILFALAVCAGTPVAQAPIPSPLGDVVPELSAQSSWAQDWRDGDESADLRRRGVYPIGNGSTFGFAGLGRHANTVQGLTGPHYQTPTLEAGRGHFGELSCELERGGVTLALPDKRVRRVRGAGFVLTEDATSGGPTLRTLCFAPPDTEALWWIVEVQNTSPQGLDDLVLRVRPEAADSPSETGLLLRGLDGADVRGHLTMSDGRADAATLAVTLAPLAAGESWRGALRLSAANGRSATFEETVPSLATATELARSTVAWWQQRLDDTTYFDTDHRKLADLFTDWKVLVLSQRCARSGVVSSMVTHRRASVRDSLGAMLLFLRFGMFDEARDLLLYYHRATQVLGEVPVEARLDLDLDGLDESRTDWNQIRVPHAEVPSWLVLLHSWYWRATGDLETVARHWPLLEVCMKRQEQLPDYLQSFHGSEPFLRALGDRFPDPIGDGSMLIAHDVEHNRACASFASSMLFGLAVYSTAQILDAMDRQMAPERWVDEPPVDSAGSAYALLAAEIMASVESQYWLEDEQRFAPARSPVNGEAHRTPFAEVSLLPIFAGWTYPTGNKSRANLRNTATELWRSGARIGSTPTTGYATGATQGLLVFALAEHDAARTGDALAAMLAMAEPAGTWSDAYAPDGRRAPGAGAPTSPLDVHASGTNLEAAMFALTGIRYAAVPAWDHNDIRLGPRLLAGARYLTLKRVRKDGRELDFYANRTRGLLSKEERIRNQALPPEQRLDDRVEHERMAYRVELRSKPPATGYWDIVLDVAGKTIIEYLWPEKPLAKSAVWKAPTDEYFPVSQRPATPLAPSPADGADVLVLASRGLAGRIHASPSIQIVDTGLPATAQQLADLLIDDAGRPRYRSVMLDFGFDAPDARTMKTAAFWSSEAWTSTLAAFEAAGGAVLRPEYVQRFQVLQEGRWQDVVAPTGHLDLGTPHAHRIRTSVTVDSARTAVLRIGSGCGYALRMGGQEIAARTGGRHAWPDHDAVLVQLQKGDNQIEIDLLPDGAPIVSVRVTDDRGLPLDG